MTDKLIEALERIESKLKRAGAQVPIVNEGTVDSAIKSGLSIALMLVEDELKAARSQQEAAQELDAKAATDRFTVERHRNGWAIYTGRGNFHHGMNWGQLSECDEALAKRIESALNASPAPSESEARAWLYPIGGGRYAATTDESAARSASTDGSYHALVVGAALSASEKGEGL